MSPFLILMLLTLISSTLMVLSSSNWLFIWVALEINMLSFIPIMLQQPHSKQLESATKYFLIQALGSSVLLMYSSSLWFEVSMPVPYSTMLMVGTLIKLGAAPFHFWYPQIMSGSTWSTCFLLSTWQKLGPLLLLSFLLSPTSLLLSISLLTALMGGLTGVNQTRLRAIMAYSSLTHMGWIMVLMSTSFPYVSTTYFLFYSLFIIPLFILFSTSNSSVISSLSMSLGSIPLLGVTVCLMLLVLSGMPPFAGFLLKWMSMYVMSDQPKLLLILIVSSLMSAYYYINLLFTSTLSSTLYANHMSATNLPTTSIMSISSWTALLILPLSIFML